jgi:hypothetical protein
MPRQRASTPINRGRTRRGDFFRARFLSVLVWVGLGTLLPSRTQAEPRVLVLLLRPVPTNELLAETILRIKSELVAGGFEVAVADSESVGEGRDLRALMERAGQGLAPSATIGIFGNLDPGPSELWIVDRITGKTVIRRLEVQATGDRRISEVLAIRTQELLRASLVELLLEGDRPTPAAAPPPQVQRWVKQAVEAPLAPWTLALEVGASTFGGWGGIGPTLAPAARLRMAWGEHFWGRLTGVGLGTRPTVQSAVGSASVSQNLLLLEGAVWLRPRRRVRPLFSLGLGAERVAVDGKASQSDYQGLSNARWFAAGDVGAGVALRLRAHWEVLLEVHALFATPRPSVRFFDLEAARAGQPMLLAILTLAGGA